MGICDVVVLNGLIMTAFFLRFGRLLNTRGIVNVSVSKRVDIMAPSPKFSGDVTLSLDLVMLGL